MMHSGHNSLHSAQQVCLPANLCAIARMVHSGHNSLYIVQSLYSAQQVCPPANLCALCVATSQIAAELGESWPRMVYEVPGLTL
eukprot:scaffold150463_cov18-Tisochrysis_lutea.AAC.1